MHSNRYACLLGLAAALLAPNSFAAYPDRPIRMVVPYAAGSATDLIARQIMPNMAKILGQPIVIDNKGGANAMIGATEVARARPDGYTILFGGIQTHGTNPSLQKNLPYDPIADFTPVARLQAQPLLLVVSSKLGIKTVAELLAYAKSNPEKLNYASTGSGTSAHLATEGFNRHAGVTFLHVPYKSAPQALVDVSNGDVTMYFYTYLPTLPFVQSGALNILATTNRTRLAVLPQVPTMAELGYPQSTISAWQALYAPAGTPREVVNVLYYAVRKTMESSEVRHALESTGTEVWLGTPEETAEFTRSEIERLREMVRSSGVTAQ